MPIKYPDPGYKRCPACNGEGFIDKPGANPGYTAMKQTCYNCDGSGQVRLTAKDQR